MKKLLDQTTVLMAKIREKSKAELSKAAPEISQADKARASWLDGTCFTETKYTPEQEAIMKNLLDQTTVRMAKIREKRPMLISARS